LKWLSAVWAALELCAPVSRCRTPRFAAPTLFSAAFCAYALSPLRTAHAQEGPNDGGDSKILEIRRVDAAPVIDGRLDDRAWAEAAVVEDLHQVQPVEYAAPTERTIVYALYDADTLYVAAKMYDREPELINARVLRQNQAIGPDDRFFLHLDPFGNRRSGYIFGVNPNGVRFDGVFQNVTDRQFDWDGIWNAAATIDAEGWTVEIAIPFKTLSFDPANDRWRMNFVRYIIRRNEQMAWASRNRNTDPTTMGNVVGMRDLDQGLGLDVVPSLSVRERRTYATGASDSESEPSLDAFYKITPGLNGALTINTDFSATEVDNRQVNLTRFNLFFPERRDFFLQDLDIFQFASLGRTNMGNETLENSATTRPSRENGRPFFSRSLGIGPTGEEVDLKYGGKLSGRVGRWDVGALAVRQDDYSFAAALPTPQQDPESVRVDATTAFVGRVAANVLDESSIGLIMTSGNPRATVDNTLVGTDFRYVNSRLPGGRRLEADAWYQQTDTDDLLGDDSALGVGVRMPNNRGFRGGAAAKRLEANFNPALGYVSRTGVDDYTVELGRTWRPTGAIQTIYSGLDVERIEFIDDGSVQSEVRSLRAFEADTRGRDSLKLQLTSNEEGLRAPFEISRGVIIPAGTYKFDDFEARIATGNQRKFAGGFAYRSGDFFGGERLGLEASLGWRPNKYLRTNLEYFYDDVTLPQGDFIVRLVRLAVEAAFTSTISWVNLIQYDNVSNAAGINSRLHWIPEAGREGFIVLNHNVVEDLIGDGHFHSSAAELTVKFGYTFRF
jgi:hypothetical protein